MLIKFVDNSNSKDLSNSNLLIIIGLSVSTSLGILLATKMLPLESQQPGSPFLQSAAIIGTILLALSFCSVLAKRAGKPGKKGFKAHVWLASIGTILVIAHSGSSAVTIPGVLLVLLLFITTLGLWIRLILPRQMSNTFGTKLAGFSTPDEIIRTELKNLIQEKQVLLKKIDPIAKEAIFSIGLRNWVNTPVLAYRYQKAVDKENHLIGTHKSVSRIQAYSRSLHRILSLFFLCGLIIHILIVTFFAGYVANGRTIYWWFLTEWGS